MTEYNDNVEACQIKARMETEGAACQRCASEIPYGAEFGIIQFMAPVNQCSVLCLACWQEFWREVAG